MPVRPYAPLAALLVLALAACDSVGETGVIRIALIGQPEEVFEKGLRLAPSAQQVRAATAEGLVALDGSGAVVPAIAERWIVTDDGMSYIFRLRNAQWPDGRPMTAEQVRDALRRTIRELQGTSLGLDLAPVSEVRAMTGRVIEIRLSSPMPDFLQLLAQPELGVFHRGMGTGPMTLERTGATGRLTLLPPEARGLPARDDWQEGTRILAFRALPARGAVELFRSGGVDLVFGGTIIDLPLAPTGPLSRGTIRLDAAQGLLGLKVLRDEGLLAEPARREALAMAIERETLLAPFNIAGWIASTRIVPAQVVGEGAGERWSGSTIDARRADARRRIAGFDGPRTVTIALPQGPGADLLFREIASDWQEIGVTAVRARRGEGADLELVDTLARFGGRRWYLDQFACTVRRTLCDPKADELVREAVVEADPASRATLLAEAETRLTARQGYIPLGAPVRWSLVRGDIAGFVENAWAVHPLYPLALPPT